MTILNQHPILAPLLEGLSPEELAPITVTEINANEPIISRGVTTSYVYIIIKGVCDIMVNHPDGRCVNACKITNLDIIGLTALLNLGPLLTSPNATVISRTTTLLAKIPTDHAYALFDKHPLFLRNMSRSIINRLYEGLVIMRICSTQSIQINLVTYLTHTYYFYRQLYPENYMGAVKIYDTRQAISDYLGIGIRSTNRYIELLKNDHYITLSRGKIHITAAQYELLKQLTTDLSLEQ